MLWTQRLLRYGFEALIPACASVFALTGTPAIDDAPSIVVDSQWAEAISRPYTAANSATVLTVFSEAISRAHTVLNRIIDTLPYQEAISRSLTVRNDTTPLVVFGEAISRSHTVENGTIPLLFSEALSRPYTVDNRTVPPVVFTEAISHPWTVLNHPELRLELQSETGDVVAYARCGESIRYRVVGTMNEGNNQGLALVTFDVRYDGGVLPPMETQVGELSCENPMVSFVGPAGFTEPTGFGGKVSPARDPQCGHPNGFPAGLTRVGGAQNTFGTGTGRTGFTRFIDCFAGPHVLPTPTPPLTAGECLDEFDADHDDDVDLFDFSGIQRGTLYAPSGGVLLGVAQPGGCGTAVLAEGSLVAPSAPGEYRLWLESPIANAIAKDATGNPFWRTRRAVVNVRNQLTINVVGTRCDARDFEYFQFADCFSGPGVVPDPPPPYMTTKECLGAFDDDKDGDVDLRDWAEAQVAFQPRPCTAQAIVSSSSPAECAIDARQPSNPNGLNPMGYSSITLIMRCPTAGLTPSAFTVSTTPSGSVPAIQGVTPSGRDATLQLSGPISPGRWTCFTHTASNTKACIGYLPGDVDGNGVVEPQDETVLSSRLTNPATLIELCDINRDGVCNGDDLTRLEDLFYCQQHYGCWLGQSLPLPCPSGP